MAVLAHTNGLGETVLQSVRSTQFIAATPVTFSHVELEAIRALVRCCVKQPECTDFSCFEIGMTSAGGQQVRRTRSCCVLPRMFPVSCSSCSIPGLPHEYALHVMLLGRPESRRAR
jgi:hypothetical protein